MRFTALVEITFQTAHLNILESYSGKARPSNTSTSSKPCANALAESKTLERRDLTQFLLDFESLAKDNLDAAQNT